MKPRAPLPWESDLDRTRAHSRLIRSVGGEVIAYDVGAPDADYIVHAANAYPKLVEMVKWLSDGATVRGQWSLLARQARELLKELGETRSGLGISSDLPPE
jgi:hypothetical protein